MVFELFYGSQWNDITGDVRYSPDVSIRWGRDSEARRASPSRLSVALENADGKYSTRNPLSPLYGLIGRNTPIRFRESASRSRLTLPGRQDDYASAFDSPALDITGDIDIRIEVEPRTWRPVEGGGGMHLLSKYAFAGVDDRSWAVVLDQDGRIRMDHSPDGTLASRIATWSTESVPDDSGTLALRWTLDVDAGAGLRQNRFYVSSDTGLPLDDPERTWTELGLSVTASGTTSIHSGDADVTIGATDGGTAFEEPFLGHVHSAMVLDGIDGTVVLDVSFSGLDTADQSLVDDAGLVWVLRGDSAITDPAIRFYGEVHSWPPLWDLSGKDVRTPITASGIRRRLSQGAKPLHSAMFRGLSTDNVTSAVAYWPMEEGEDASIFDSPFVGVQPMRYTPEVKLSAFSDAAASDSLPTFTSGTAFGTVPEYSSNTSRFMVYMGAPDSLTSDARIFEFSTTGSAFIWRLSLTTAGGLNLKVFDEDNNSLLDSTIGFDIMGERGFLWLLMQQDGADIDYQVGILEEGSTNIGFSDGTITGETQGVIKGFTLGAESGDGLNGMAIGHAIVIPNNNFWQVAPFLRAWSGETAVERVSRLCAEEGVPLRLAPGLVSSQRVGPQYIDTFLKLLDDAADVDVGSVEDDRDALRLVYRSGPGRYNRPTALTLDYGARQVAPKLRPVEDDRSLHNDVTVRRVRGSSARATLESGPLSTQPPPDGVGRYETEVALIAETDSQLPDLAGWRLHLGTVDEPRYPSVSVDLVATPSLTTDVENVESGHRVEVTNPPPWLPPDAISQMVDGGREVITPRTRRVHFNCSPGSSWSTIGEVGVTRVDTDGSRLDGDINDSALSMDVETLSGNRAWVTDLGQLPLNVFLGGEVVTVSAIGAESGGVQTFTISARSVNGVTKSHSAGTSVRLASEHWTILGL